MENRPRKVRNAAGSAEKGKGRGRQEGSGRSQKEQVGKPQQQQRVLGTDEPTEKVSPRLTLVATPIGNLGDISPRCSAALSEANFWIVEDTRISAKLAFHLNVKKPMRVAHDHSQDSQLNRLLDEIELGQQAVLLTDGGAPGVSDPGARLVDLA